MQTCKKKVCKRSKYLATFIFEPISLKKMEEAIHIYRFTGFFSFSMFYFLKDNNFSHKGAFQLEVLHLWGGG